MEFPLSKCMKRKENKKKHNRRKEEEKNESNHWEEKLKKKKNHPASACLALYRCATQICDITEWKPKRGGGCL